MTSFLAMRTLNKFDLAMKRQEILGSFVKPD